MIKHGAELKVGDIIIVRGIGNNPSTPRRVDNIIGTGDHIRIVWDDGVESVLDLDAHIETVE